MEDWLSSVPQKIRDEQRKSSRKTIRKLTKKHIHTGDALCTLAEVRDALIGKGVNSDKFQYIKNDFSEKLDIKMAEADFNLSIPLFPKRNPSRDINLIVAKADLHENFDSKTTPEGIADFILGIAEWLPEYYSIENRIKVEEMQRQTVRDLAVDLLERNIGAILKEKGYTYTVSSSSFTDTANFRICISDAVEMSLEIDLMADFLNDVTRVVESLPANEYCIA